uniref:Uncharacterized protein n=1 Tax=Pseudomonas marincola TaxID=437900 RepID=A0A653E5B9_9PSED
MPLIQLSDEWYDSQRREQHLVRGWPSKWIAVNPFQPAKLKLFQEYSYRQSKNCVKWFYLLTNALVCPPLFRRQ